MTQGLILEQEVEKMHLSDVGAVIGQHNLIYWLAQCQINVISL